MSDAQARAIADAVMYALRQGCFFPVRMPRAPYRVRDLRKWGAMKNLHNKIAALSRREIP